MGEGENRNSKADYLFFIAYGIFLIFTMLSTSFYYPLFFGWVYTLLLLSVIGILGIRELINLKQYTLRTILYAIICIFFMFLALKTCDGARKNVLLCTFFVIYCARNLSVKKILRFSMYILSILLVFVIVSSQLGIIENYLLQTGDRSRYFLGFRYALYASTFLFNITALVVFLRKEKLLWRDVIVLSLANIYIFMKTNARLNFILVFALLFIVMVMKKSDVVKKVLQYFRKPVILVFLICAVGSIGVTYIYNENSSIMKTLDETMGTRLSLGHKSIEEYGVPLLGQEVEWIGNGLNENGEVETGEYNYVDNMYLQILQRFGILFFIIALILLTKAVKKAYEKEDYWLIAIMCILAFHGIIDDLIIYLHYNSFWLAIIYVMDKEQQSKNLLSFFPKLVRKE